MESMPRKSKGSLDQAQEARITALEEGQKEIIELLRPISETYRTVSTLGKWMMAVLVFISILLSILISTKNLFK